MKLRQYGLLENCLGYGILARGRRHDQNYGERLKEIVTDKFSGRWDQAKNCIVLGVKRWKCCW